MKTKRLLTALLILAAAGPFARGKSGLRAEGGDPVLPIREEIKLGQRRGKYIVPAGRILPGGPPRDGVIEDTVNGADLGSRREAGGVMRMLDRTGGGELIKERDFWFAWHAFHLDTLPYEEKER